MIRSHRPATLAGLLCLVLLVTAWSPAVAADPIAQTPDPLAPEHMSLIAMDTFVAPDDVLDLALRLDRAPEGATLDLALHERITAGRLRFLQTIGGTSLGADVRSYDALPVADLPTDERGDVVVSLTFVAEGDPPLAGFLVTEPGVHPLSLTLRDADRDELDELVVHVVRLPAPGDAEAGTELSVATVVPIEAPLALRPDGTQTAPTDALSGIDITVSALAEHPDVPLSVAPTPETLEALDADREGLDGDTIDTLAASLRGRQVLARPYVPLATSSWVAASDPTEIVVQLDAGLEVTDRLLDAPARRGTWVLDPTVDGATLAVLRTLGVDRVVVPEGQLGPLPADFDRTLTGSFVVRDGDGVTMPAFGTDGTLGLELVSADDAALAANRVLADLAVLHLDENVPGRGVVLEVSGGAETPVALDPLLEGLGVASQPPAGAAPVLSPVTLDGLFDDVGPALDDDDATLERTFTSAPPVDLGALPAALDLAEASLRSYRTMLPDGTDPTAALARRLLLATAHRDITATLRQDLLDEAVALLAGQLAEIEAPPQGAVTLTSSEGSIPVVLENGLDEVVRVRLELTAEKLEFPDGTEQEVDLQPGTNRVEVRVRARASGAFPAEIVVTSPDGQLQVGDTRIQVRSTAVSGLGLVLAITAGAFLALWWARNLRSNRRGKRLVGSDTAEARPPTPTPPDDVDGLAGG